MPPRPPSGRQSPKMRQLPALSRILPPEAEQRPAVIFNGFLGTSDAGTSDFLGRYLYVRLTQFR